MGSFCFEPLQGLPWFFCEFSFTACQCCLNFENVICTLCMMLFLDVDVGTNCITCCIRIS